MQQHNLSLSVLFRARELYNPLQPGSWKDFIAKNLFHIIATQAEVLLAELEQKKLNLEKRGKIKAVQSAKELYGALKGCVDELKQSQNIEEFDANWAELLDKEKATERKKPLKENIQQLSKHRGWKDFFTKLLFVIITVGMYPLVKGSRFFKEPLTNTDTINMLEKRKKLSP